MTTETEGRQRRRRTRNPDVDAVPPTDQAEPSAESASVEEDVPAPKKPASRTKKPATGSRSKKPKPAPKNPTGPRPMGPLEIEGTVSSADVPGRGDRLYVQFVQGLIERAETSDDWAIIAPGDRKANTIQSGLASAASGLGVRLQTRTRDLGPNGEERLLVRIRPASLDSDAAATE